MTEREPHDVDIDDSAERVAREYTTGFTEWQTERVDPKGRTSFPPNLEWNGKRFKESGRLLVPVVAPSILQGDILYLLPDGVVNGLVLPHVTRYGKVGIDPNGRIIFKDRVRRKSNISVGDKVRFMGLSAPYCAVVREGRAHKCDDDTTQFRMVPQVLHTLLVAPLALKIFGASIERATDAVDDRTHLVAAQVIERVIAAMAGVQSKAEGSHPVRISGSVGGVNIDLVISSAGEEGEPEKMPQ